LKDQRVDHLLNWLYSSNYTKYGILGLVISHKRI